jgi:DNA-binding GntR family transcriptional regulator
MGKTTGGNLSSLIYRELRELITYGKLNPGEKIVESNLIKQFNISRTPVREAIRMLQARGFVEATHNKGTYVKKISVKELENIYDALSALEGFAVHIATQNMTRKQIEMLEKSNNKLRRLNSSAERKKYVEKNLEFHSLFSQFCGNDFLGDLIQETRNRVYRYRIGGIAMEGHIHEFISDHEGIIESIKRGDAQKSEEKMRQHIRRTKDILAGFLREFLI